jgi:hypothetical protein
MNPEEKTESSPESEERGVESPPDEETGSPHERQAPESADQRDETARETRSALSEAQLRARRENAQKSTGPRTPAGIRRVSGNALKHGRYAGRSGSYAESLRAGMVELGEDPREFERIEKGLRDSFVPANDAQDLLVHEIALLYWQRRRLVRAQAALQACRMDKLEIDRERESLQVSQQMHAQLTIADFKAGLVWARESPTKFQKMLEGLEVLQASAEDGDYQSAEDALRWMYGKSPSLRGAIIRQGFQALANAGSAPDPLTVSRLKLELEREVTNITAQYTLYLRERTELTPTMLDACLAPTKKERWLVQQMNSIDRHIRLETALLLDMQRADQSGRKGEKPPGEGQNPKPKAADG